MNVGTGMNLIWNFPDATKNVLNYFQSGHVVAPKANFGLQGGNGEGNL